MKTHRRLDAVVTENANLKAALLFTIMVKKSHYHGIP